jgi:pimeloyl-ACP methyl ester carboxylesterase
MPRGSTFWWLVGVVLLCGGLGLAAGVQRQDGVSVDAVEFEGASGARMRALLFRPATATPEDPAPAILAIHGYLNSAEMQSNYAIEFARRGYVVLAPDQRGHGASDPAAFADGFGGPDSLAYLRALPFVDAGNIGLEGHSMGGWAVLAAARSNPDGYRAMVLQGSSVGAPFAPEGDGVFPRNLLVVFATHDEFGGFMWGPESPARTGATAKAMALFGTDRPIEAGRLHGDIDAGTARLLQTPRMTHAWLHHSPTAIAAALDWFDRTLTGQRRLPPADQVWPRKELGTALALAGIAPFVIGLFGILAGRWLPESQARLAARPAPPASALARRATLIGLLLIPVASYVPLMSLAESLISENLVFRQTFSNQIAFWLACNALLAWAASLLPGMPRPAGSRVAPLRAAMVATLVAAALHLVISLADGHGHVSPQFWIAIWRPLTWARLQDFVVYLPVVLFYFAVAFRAIHGVYPLNAAGGGRAFAITAGIMAGPFAVFLAAQYATLFATGTLLFPTVGLRVIISILFVPLMALAAGIGVAACRRTGDTLPGALLAGILVAWFLVATQPMGAD